MSEETQAFAATALISCPIDYSNFLPWVCLPTVQLENVHMRITLVLSKYLLFYHYGVFYYQFPLINEKL